MNSTVKILGKWWYWTNLRDLALLESGQLRSQVSIHLFASLQANVWEINSAIRCFVARQSPSNLVNTIFCLVPKLCYLKIFQNLFFKKTICHQIPMNTANLGLTYRSTQSAKRGEIFLRISDFSQNLRSGRCVVFWSIVKEHQSLLFSHCFQYVQICFFFNILSSIALVFVWNNSYLRLFYS